MSLLKWKPAYALAIPSVDLEHREMIAMINECHEQIDDNADAQTIEETLGEIYVGIGAHFALEEALMCKAGFDEYQAHKQDHEDLLDEIRELMDEYARDPVAGKARLQSSLSNWFGRHFATFDARLHDKLQV